MEQYAIQDLLSLFPVLRSLPSSGWNRIACEAQHLIIPQGRVLFEINSPCQAFPLLLSGSIRVVSISENGRELLLYRLEPGHLCVLSSSCLLGNTFYPASGIAESNLSLVMLSPMLFNWLVSQCEPFRTFVFSVFADRLSELMRLVEAVAFLKLDQRLAVLLLTKGNEIHTTHQKLADELGSVRELISRLLKRFEDQGVVALNRKYIQILDIDALHNIAA